MRYLIIQNAIIYGADEPCPIDLLIKNGKIIDIAPKILRPNFETPIFNAEGKYIIPSFVDASSSFPTFDSLTELTNTIEFDILKGVSTWIAPESIQNIINTKIEANQSRLNYSYHFSLKNLRMNDINRIRQLKILNGIPSIFYQCKIDEISDLAQHIEVAQHYDLVLVINLTNETLDDMKIMSSLVNNLKDARCITMINNIRYREEYEIISQSANENLHLNFNIANSNSSELTNINNDIIDILLNNQRASVTFKEYNMIEASPNVLSKLIELDTEHRLTRKQIKEFIIDRLADILGLSPEKRNIDLGCDADFCVFDEKNNQIDALIIDGKVIFDKNTEFCTVKGNPLYRRIL